MRQNDCFVIACACLFLAGKIEETPKALTDILKVVSGVRFAKQPRELEHVMAMQDELRERVLQAERAVMYALGFNMSILHPYRIALNLVNERGFRLKMHTPLRNNLYDLPQIIFNTQLSLQYKAEQIAVAVVHLAMKMLLSEAPLWDGRHWWQHCNVTAAQLQDMLSQILEVLDQRSRQVDYSNFGPHFLPQSQSYEGTQQNESPDPGSSTHVMVSEEMAAPGAASQPLTDSQISEAGLKIAEPLVGSDNGIRMSQQAGVDGIAAERTQDAHPPSA
ncbi:hypothetical protein COCSUDRAFT_60988 [Coccomyxa subellipsoidea C-169]|uniref:Uncharacterized protein n=1 Tax=Coccomyxa subellipsoidea (strain C-169) TaxID=574566 RepID=I0Z5S4_COCSC|nr:hypothetical protein COCSUDRAFT_60988 [Coccomyxa subellipsoidea C-169]EIE25993.1 hypothetical protein COCSUDRAFT_60988 [Coccomyxa subellipsoidea C-169]|eukprot:XP_005650537.1 hypothetical protein COCSUDRAFT_60988 [Coccomyxa subellipsoidea C-169]